MTINLISFGYGHDSPPRADITYDLRRLFRNPAANPAMRQMTGLDDAVVTHVWNTAGIRGLVEHTVMLLLELADVFGEGADITVAVGCAGGRHRSVVVAESVTEELADHGKRVTCVHRDLHRPVLAAGGGQ